MPYSAKKNERSTPRDMRKRLRIGLALRPRVPALCYILPLLILVLLLLLSGCAKLIEPLLPRTPTPMPSPTIPPTVGPPKPTLTEEPTVSADVFPPGRPTVVPILYKMFDWGTDYQNLHPEWGPIGSIQFVKWEQINPEYGVYNWGPIDRYLAKEASLKVTMPDGTEIQKPVVIQVFAHISSKPGWKATYYDATPGWVYNSIDAGNPDDLRPVVYGKKVGHALNGCGTQAVLPMYDSSLWRDAYYAMVRALGERYNDNPQVTSVVINTGLDGETQPVKDLHCPWNTEYLDKQASGVRYAFSTFMYEAMTVYREAFPTKPIFINNAPGGSGTRKSTSDFAATFDPPIGLKHSGMWVDLDSHQGYGDFYGSWDLIRAYSMTLPIWLESPFGMGSSELRYWSFIAGLNYHPDAIDCHPEYFPQSDPEWLRFVVDHLGVNINNTPDVWTVLRDAEYPLVSWGKGGVSGKMGDWTFWLYRKDDIPQNETERVMREDIPAAKDHVFSRQTRRTIQDQNQFFMSFDIDDNYPYVDQKPIDVQDGNVHYIIDVTLLNMGTDTFSLQYRNWDGGIISQTMRKGPELGPIDDWVTVSFVVRDGYFNNNMPGECDFRISCERDGDEYIHMVRVEGGWGVPPPPTMTPQATVTPRPSPTAVPSSTMPPGPTPTPSITPVPPTPEPTPTMPPGATRFTPAEDTFLDQWNPQEAFFNAPALSVRQGDIKTALLRFDLSSLPANAVIDTALLSLYVQGRSNSGSLQVSFHKVLHPWDERHCTWKDALLDKPWGLAGCNDPNRDRSSITVGQVNLTETQRWVNVPLTNLVQEWIDIPSRNYGIVLKGDGPAAVQYDFFSANHASGTMHPSLWIAWHEGAVTPTIVHPTEAPSVTPTKSPQPSPTETKPPPGPTSPPTKTLSAPATETPSGPSPSSTPAFSPTPLPPRVSIVLREGDGYTGALDTYLDAWAEDKNFQDSTKMIARQGAVRVPLMRFDLTAIPDYASVKEATLHLYATSRTNPAVLHLSVAKVKRHWSPEHVTWNQSTSSEAWFQSGARDVASDRSAAVYASGQIAEERQWTEWDITHLVQEWVSAPGHNYGLLLLAEGSVSVQYDFTTSKWYPTDFRPYLEISYIPARPSPTPIATNTPTLTPTSAATATPTMTPFPSRGNIVLQQGIDSYQGCKDTYIDRWNPQQNNAPNSKLVVRQGDVRSALLRFDLEAMPISSHINKAELQLYVQSSSGPHALPVQVYSLARPWDINEVTFQRADRELAWSQEGVNEPGKDRLLEPIAHGTLTDKKQWVTFDIASAAQEWVTFPERNYGLVIKADGNVAVEYVFVSSEWRSEPALRPNLYLDWEPAPPTPTITGTPPTPTPSPTATVTPTNTPVPTPTRPQHKLAFQQGLANYQGVSDTYLDAWYQEAMMGENNRFSVRQGGIRVGLIRYDLSQVPRDATITEATLNLWVTNKSNPSSLSLYAFRLHCPWEEGTATWLRPDSDTLWGAPGTNAPCGDHEDELVGEVSLGGAQEWTSIDITKAAQFWAQHPEENFGLLLIGHGGASVEYQFASSQWKDRHQRPKLLLTYELEPDVSEVAHQKMSDALRRLMLALGVSFAMLLVIKRLISFSAPQDENKGDPVS